MNNQDAYNQWSSTYDTVENKTRDIEAKALRSIFSGKKFKNVLEAGCGTGKNTEWFADFSENVLAVDFSEDMIAKAKEKIKKKNVQFQTADVTQTWNFPKASFDLISCSLILEHIENLNHVFSEAYSSLKSAGIFYIGELHPFKQYQGSKARFETGQGEFELECFVHHVSDYFEEAKAAGFNCLEIKEWFDEGNSLPRLITLIFEKN